MTLTIRGGTNVRMSPPVDYYQHVLPPFFKVWEWTQRWRSCNEDFISGGSGADNVGTSKGSPATDLEERGRLEEMGGVCFVQNLPDHVATRMAHAIGKSFLGGKPAWKG